MLIELADYKASHFKLAPFRVQFLLLVKNQVRFRALRHVFHCLCDIWEQICIVCFFLVWLVTLNFTLFCFFYSYCLTCDIQLYIFLIPIVWLVTLHFTFFSFLFFDLWYSTLHFFNSYCLTCDTHLYIFF